MGIAVMLFLQFFISLTWHEVVAGKCVNNSDQFFCKLSSKTPYRYVANYNDLPLKYPECEEKKIWMIVRHGTRFPGEKYIKPMMDELPELQDKILESFETNTSKLPLSLIQRISDWKISFDASQTMNLAPEGENELIELAERMQARFPKLFPEYYNEDLFKFKYTNKQRTKESARHFTLGLFGQNQSLNIEFPEPEQKDPILRFYKKCERWRKEIKKNPESFREKDLFVQSKLFQNILSEISARVGFKLDYETTRLMYLMCSFETAWSENTKSPWCDVFTYNDMKAIDFIQDLEHYLVDGYQHRLNYEQACPAFKDMFTFFGSSNKTLVTAYFSHSGAILKILSMLGIAKDENRVTHKSFPSQVDSRKWKTSLIDAFASNIAFVLYDCKKVGQSILLLHQERPIQIPGCSDELCPISTMKDLFPDTEQECEFDSMCSLEQKTK